MSTLELTRMLKYLVRVREKNGMKEVRKYVRLGHVSVRCQVTYSLSEENIQGGELASGLIRVDYV